MISETTDNSNIVFYHRDITPEEDMTLSEKCNIEAAKATLRKLRFMILFAQSEPATIPVYDEDTGEIGPQEHRQPTYAARYLARKSMDWGTTASMLADLGWSEETTFADWETMLRLLPLEALQPGTWPG